MSSNPIPTATKVIVTNWKEINGWDFGCYLDKENSGWHKIRMLRKNGK